MIDSQEVLLARKNRALLAYVLLSSEVQVQKSIIISLSYDQLVHDQSYTISRGNNPRSPVLTLAHAKGRITRAKSQLT